MLIKRPTIRNVQDFLDIQYIYLVGLGCPSSCKIILNDHSWEFAHAIGILHYYRDEEGPRRERERDRDRESERETEKARERQREREGPDVPENICDWTQITGTLRL